jgi:SOS-response transcriptional repressor LexA
MILTARQAEVLAFIDGCKSPPEVREICRHFGWVSKNAAWQHLNALEDGGFIERERRKGVRQVSRNITVRPSIWSALSWFPEIRGTVS